MSASEDGIKRALAVQLATFVVCAGFLVFFSYIVFMDEFGTKHVIWSLVVALMIIAFDTFKLLRNRK